MLAKGCANFKTYRRNCFFLKGVKWLDNCSFFELMLACLHSLKHNELEMLCVMFWHGWWIRNQVLHNSKGLCDKDVVGWLENYLASSSSANDKEVAPSSSSQSTVVR
ncbi:hypothetical protein EZV62_015208 [Acer yangbiense]|uniref:Uncharacterized protein n=1 Tax=Acer yangbiense TaxID=1000413 RepID=A0A5C7HUR8_9ROSI|nr:hypothetical protein EZV62_015208 [Acer yangbiense]